MGKATEYSWNLAARWVGVRGDCWEVWWRDPEQKYHCECIARVETLKDVRAAIRTHKASRP